ncbi:MAG: efflux RND transporter permease subunit [Bdellovibrionaceae bacterium]|nr:efflux RND transporter permease subunit [Bdellovibrionales bacterium]MCB9083528.1 efflux RND transporter permease subunit [Pseudobdellovibrionaceae bacterium]
MKQLLGFFISNYKLSWLLMAVLVLMGFMGLRQVKRESRPPVDFARVTVATIYPGASPEEVEEQVTLKIENELRGIEGVKDIKSLSATGRSEIALRLDIDSGDPLKAQDEIHRAVQRVRGLPQDIKDTPSVRVANAKEIPILELALIGGNENRRRDRLANDLRLLLEDSRGVADVVMSGYREREFQILLKPNLMQQAYVGIGEVVDAVKRRTLNIPAGFIRSPDNQRLVRVTGQIQSAEEMGEIIIRSNFSGQKIRIRDVAEIKDGMEDPSVMVRVNSEPATLITVTKRADADAIRVVENLNKQLEVFRKDKLPDGYSLISYNDEASRIAERLDIVVVNGLSGLVLVLVILLFFLPGSLGFVASLSLPLAILGALALMPLMGVNFNNITMLALVISIGMLVDNSVVISENYARLRAEGYKRQPAALKAVHQFWLPLTATVLTTIAAFLPMLVTKGVMGQFIRWIPIMVSIALVMSLIESFILLPSRLQFTVLDNAGNKDPSAETKTNWFEPLRIRFERFMDLCIRRRYLVFLALSLLLLSSLVLARYGNRFELFPTDDVEYYFSGFSAPITTNLETMDKMTKRVSEEATRVLGNDNIDYVIARSGVSRRSGSENSVNGEYVGMMVIAVTANAAKTLDPQEVLQRLRTIDRGQLETLTFDASRHGPPVGAALSATFRSKDYRQLKSFVTEFQEQLTRIPGVVDVENDEVRGGPEYRIVPNHGAISSMNLDTQTIGVALRTALQGAVATELTLDGDDFDLRIRYDDQQRETFNAIKATHVMEKTGKLIPLSSLVRIEDTEGPAVRKHHDFKRSITVQSGVIPSVITSIALNEKAQSIAANLKRTYPAVTSVFGGEQESTQESMTSLQQALLLALLGIFAILVLLFHSFLHSGLILSTIFLGLVGISWAFFLHNRPLSFLAMIGTVGLAGVVVNSAIVLVSYINDLKQEKPHLDLHQILAQASGARLRAVMVTSLTTIGGLLPTAYGWGGYERMLVPMTLALAWGLASGTILTLIWVPCGYAIVEDISLWWKSRLSWLLGRFEEGADTPNPMTMNNSPDDQRLHSSTKPMEDRNHDLTL